MRRHTLIGYLTLGLVITLGVGQAPAQAAGTRVGVQQSPRALNASSVEITKTTLADTSIDGPALWTTTNGPIRGVLAWTQADAAHHLAVMTTAIGTKFTNKVVLGETSFARPAVTRTPSGKVALAWSGTDAQHTLNVLYDVYGSRLKLTLWGETSDYSPSLVAAPDGSLVLGWTGQNSSHSLNTQGITTAGGLARSWKVTLWSYGSLSAPNMSFEASRTEYVMGWIAPAPARQVAVARSADGKAWSSPTIVAEWSYSTPSVLGIVGNYYNMPPHYLAWTGMDSARSLNYQYTRSFPAWPDSTNTKVTLPETAYQAPALGFISGPSLTLLAWTGTDAAHHLNVAVLTPMSPPPCSLPGITPVPATVITQGTSGRKEVALTFDAGGAEGNPNSLLNTLESAGVPSTWFFTGEWVQGHESIARRVSVDGIKIGNHTVDHPDLVTPPRSDNYVCYQLGLANQLIADRAGISGTRPYFRPPYGSYNAQVVNRAAGIGYYTVLWSLDTLDWQDSMTADDIYNRVRSQLAPGKIILMHVGSLHEPEALPRVIEYITSQGYQIVTLDRLLAP
jgi:peptidoglycan/xylan/chitin deacetylase (PgdA/CDA1 family)